MVGTQIFLKGMKLIDVPIRSPPGWASPAPSLWITRLNTGTTHSPPHVNSSPTPGRLPFRAPASSFRLSLLKLNVRIADSSRFFTAFYTAYCQLSLLNSNLCSCHTLAQNPSMILDHCTRLQSMLIDVSVRLPEACSPAAPPTPRSLSHRRFMIEKCKNTITKL